MLKLVNSKSTDIPVTKMKDGDLAVITKWWQGNYYVGTIVHRYDELLIAVGKKSGESWRLLFNGDCKCDDCRVRLLTKGETLIVE
jgi:hypothetical protein